MVSHWRILFILKDEFQCTYFVWEICGSHSYSLVNGIISNLFHVFTPLDVAIVIFLFQLSIEVLSNTDSLRLITFTQTVLIICLDILKHLPINQIFSFVAAYCSVIIPYFFDVLTPESLCIGGSSFRSYFFYLKKGRSIKISILWCKKKYLRRPLVQLLPWQKCIIYWSMLKDS